MTGAAAPRRTALMIGGGIGGVTAALALMHVGWQVRVYERATEPGELGAGIALFPNALRALDAIGVGSQVRAAGGQLPAGTGALRSPDGRLLVDASGLPLVTDLYGFHRADLHRALLSQLPAGVLQTGVEVLSVDCATGRVQLAGEADAPEPADLVVAADGLRSPTRGAIHPDQPGPRYAGYTSWRGVTAEPVDVAGVSGETWGRGERFGILPLQDGRVYWFAVANRPAAITDADPMAEIRRRFASWHRPIAALLEATAEPSVLHLDIHDLPTPLAAFGVGRVALLGDAAHAMTPDLGQGACQAIEDAVTLAAQVGAGSGDRDVPAALARYDAERRPRTERIIRNARRSGRVAQAQGPVAVRLRELLLRLTPPKAALRAAQRVTYWTPPALPTH